MTSKVFFADARATKRQESLTEKAKRVFEAAGFASVIGEGDLVVVKTHLGEQGGFRYLRPKFLKAVIDKIREHGGKPYVADTTGIGLRSSRGDALAYLRVAKDNGFTWETLGAPVLIADGLRGLGGVQIPVEAGHRLKSVEIGQAIAEADALISVAHFKGHPRTGVGGAIKNIGMGCLTKTGKAPMHLAQKPWIKKDECDLCEMCIEFCPVQAIQEANGGLKIDESRCIWGCACWMICPRKAISGWAEMHHNTNVELCLRVADACSALEKHFQKKIGYFNYVVDVTPHCDCANYSDLPLIPDVGVTASKDLVAIDKASMDLANAAKGIDAGPSAEMKILDAGKNKFASLGSYKPLEWTEKFGGPSPDQLLEACEKLGLGTINYELIRVD